jgi:hypothetical protein
MVELSTAKKNKIVLADYNYRRDIDNRLLMSQFSTLDFAVLEEILFSPIKIPIRKLAKNIDESEENVQLVLQKFQQTGLLVFEGDSVVVDKEMRKYYESEVHKFDPDFKPDMDFLQSLLKKVPIHVLPTWYAIPRTSNNIFDSLVERYLASPQIFQRYLMELNMGDPVLTAIVNDVYRAPDFCLTAADICAKYALTHEQFEESMLTLEFNFVCCLRYRKKGDEWKEVVTPFHEWLEYLAFLRNTTSKQVPDVSKIKRHRPHDYSFVQDMASVLNVAKKQSVSLNAKGYAALAAKCEELEENTSYLEQVIRKLRLIKLIDITDDKLNVLPESHEWLDMRLENRALYLYRHPCNRICSADLPSALVNERALREAEKSISRVLYSGWVLFDDFVKGVLAHINDHASVVLKKIGKNWRYTLPEYNSEEKSLLKAIVFEWLMEAGVTATGTYEGQDCFCVTAFGQSLFG